MANPTFKPLYGWPSSYNFSKIAEGFYFFGAIRGCAWCFYKQNLKKKNSSSAVIVAAELKNVFTKKLLRGSI